MAFVIRSSSDFEPAFFSPKTGRKFAAQEGWAKDAADALQFARQEDAEEFMKTYLPMIGESAKAVEL